MAIICDCCGVSCFNENLDEGCFRKHIVQLNGKKDCLCDNCWQTLTDFSCSDAHRKATEEYKLQFEQE